jgi:hypothetical protein
MTPRRRPASDRFQLRDEVKRAIVQRADPDYLAA